MDDNGSKVGYPTIRYITWFILLVLNPRFRVRLGVLPLTHYTQDKEEIKLIVQKSLENLPRLEMLILNTSLVFFQSFNGYPTPSLGETRCGHRRIGEEDEHDDSPCSTKGTAVAYLSESQFLK